MQMKSNTAQNGMAVTRLVAALLITLTVCTLSAPSWAMARPPRLGGGGGGGGGTGASGAPLPILGGTILGQACAVGGGYFVWRRARKRKQK